MFEGEDEDKELLTRLLDIICGDKMIGPEAAAVIMKRDAERYRWLRRNWASIGGDRPEWDSGMAEWQLDDQIDKELEIEKQ